jgi:hypothetical protein
MLVYLGWAAISHAAAGLEPRTGSFKLLGMAELVVLAVVTQDVVSRPSGLSLTCRALAWTGMATGVAAVLGLLLFYAGWPTPFLTDLGDLEPGPYPRVRAGFPLPNLLGSFAIVAAGAVLHRDAGLRPWMKRLALAAVLCSAALSLSRGVIGLVLALLVARSDTPTSRRAAGVYAGLAAVAMVALTYWNVALAPTRPWNVDLRAEPSSRWAAVVSAAARLAEGPAFGVGPGNLPGIRGGAPCDAHLTPLNIAATLGLPALLAYAAIPWLLWRGRPRPTDLVAWGVLAGLGLDALGQDIEDFRHLWLAFGLAARRRCAVPD